MGYIRLKPKMAFTLIELLIVVAIIGILAAIAVPNFVNAQIRAKVAGAQADHRNLSTAIESYKLDNNHYPRTYTLGYGNGGQQMSRYQRMIQLTTPIAYISSIPIDKFNSMQTEEQRGTDPINTYPYWEPKFADSYRTKTGLGKHFGNSQDAPNGQWALMSFGPDGDFEAAVDSSNLAPYEPSNGLNSNGDIMRFGP